MKKRWELTASERGYTHQWTRFRRAYLTANPLCVYCLKEGKIEAARVVDHIKPHKGDAKLFWDSKNMQSLCRPHHDVHKQREERGTVKPVIGIDGWPV